MDDFIQTLKQRKEIALKVADTCDALITLLATGGERKPDYIIRPQDVARRHVIIKDKKIDIIYYGWGLTKTSDVGKYVYLNEESGIATIENDEQFQIRMGVK